MQLHSSHRCKVFTNESSAAPALSQGPHTAQTDNEQVHKSSQKPRMRCSPTQLVLAEGAHMPQATQSPQAGTVSTEPPA